MKKDRGITNSLFIYYDNEDNKFKQILCNNKGEIKDEQHNKGNSKKQSNRISKSR